MTGAHEVVALIGFAGLIVAAACVFPGWLMRIPDSARRYGWRLACFIGIDAWLLLTFATKKHPGWLDWLWVVCFGAYVITRMAANWQAMERHRKLARLTKRLPR